VRVGLGVCAVFVMTNGILSITTLALVLAACGATEPRTTDPRAATPPPPSAASPSDEFGVATSPAPNPASTPAGVASGTGGAPAVSSAPVNASGPAADSCHVDDELTRAFASTNPGGDEKTWVDGARARLLDRTDAERALTGISQEIVSAIEHRRFDKLSRLVASGGLCLRTAKGAPCKELTVAALRGCGAARLKTSWTPGDDARPGMCGHEFRKTFYARDFLREGTVRFNCFADDGGPGAPVVQNGSRLGYVEFRAEPSADGRVDSLWMVFDGTPLAPELVELIRDFAPANVPAPP
jgi:hypothetical protein